MPICLPALTQRLCHSLMALLALRALQASYLTGPSIGNVLNFLVVEETCSEMKKRRLGNREVGFDSALESISGSTNLVKFSFDEIKKVTRNFSSDYIIGRGGYGNMYKEVLVDGSEVALKRFNNCSTAGDTSFTHEVEAWSLVHDGRALDVIEDDMPNKGPSQVLEKYVLVAVLCSHPQLYARPTMDQAVKMLETDMSIPSTLEQPIPLVAELNDIERSMSTSGSGMPMSPRGYSSYTYESDRPLELEGERQTSGSRVEKLS
ncbi:hypothetical protein FEM48_Zijuj04G0167300 [Ziziphus jujuba var. spinosa]|uniref:Uncharacterized protein n=1 Tax=Ziziphus jujuba var. spinosa TaxID=714518 RepID=A0A978VL03_ZIZJJ|nr:hypothetical protein FEM48_Zijuj04G0167300 [Ziziphus jujuba var. spinosa]